MTGPLERLTRDLTPVPFSAIDTNNLSTISVRCGDRGVGVGPDGKVYTCWMYQESKWFVSGWGPNGLPLEGLYLGGKVEKGANALSQQGKLPDPRKTRSAIIDGECNGIRVDLKGNLYLGCRQFPKGYTDPAGFEKVSGYTLSTGSVVKFRPEGGAMLRPPESKNQAVSSLKTNKDVTVEGGLAMYPGLAP